MFPWLPYINLFNFYGGSHGKLSNLVIFLGVLALELLLTHIHPSAFSSAISRSLAFFLFSTRGLFSCVNQEAPRK